MTIAKQSLLEAAKAVVKEHGDKDLGKDYEYFLEQKLATAVEALRQAIAEAEVYTPMTHDEQRLSGVLDTEFKDRKHGVEFIERAVIERLGLRWPE